MLLYHIIGFFAGFLLDLLLGDPYWLPHPIRLIGWLISKIEAYYMASTDRGKRRGGVILVLIVCVSTGCLTGLFLIGAYLIHPVVGMIMEAIMTYQILATKCLEVESMKVYKALKAKDLDGARYAISMIVGRDTKTLDETGITKAAVETVAENCSDGVIAPMFYLAIGGPILGFLYKAVNTMDSMVGYKNDKFIDFGRPAAKLDDVVNYIPARISAGLMIMGAFLSGKDFNGKQAVRIFKRDRYQHASPNSAQTESVCAGALGVQLAGDAVYFGKVIKKPYIGDPLRPIEPRDIIRVNRLLYMTATLCEGICLVGMSLLFWIWKG